MYQKKPSSVSARKLKCPSSAWNLYSLSSLELENSGLGSSLIFTRCLRISTAIYPWLKVTRTSYTLLVRILTIRSIWYYILFKNHRFLVSLNMLICCKTFASLIICIYISLITFTMYVPFIISRGNSYFFKVPYSREY